MNFFIIFMLFLAMTALLAGDVVRFDQDVRVDGYNFAFETSDGIKRDETGGTENEGISVSGSFSYVADDGVTYTVTYVADENGFQPSGVNLPAAPNY